jgi:Na+/H+ antiporter NhaC
MMALLEAIAAYLPLLPPILALVIAIWTRNVFWALGGAIWVSEIIIVGGNPLLGLLATIERGADVFSSGYSTRVILFCLIIGALIAFMQRSDGVTAMVEKLVAARLADTRRKASLVTALTGSILFMDTNVSLLSTGIMGRPLFDRLKMSRERLAYLIDATCAPISVLVVMNGWGAYLLGLLANQNVANPLPILIATIPLNFYAILTLIGVLATVASDRTFGSLKMADEAARLAAPCPEALAEPESNGKARYMALPLGIMVFGTLSLMWWTGDGNMMAGEGAKSVLWSVVLACLVAFALLRFDAGWATDKLIDTGFAGMNDLLPAVAVIFLSFALGNSLGALGTGALMAQLADGFPVPFLMPAVLFVAAGMTSFATGTSWGTYGILVPIALPVAIGLDIPLPLALAAVMGGGVFGDHCSPISDTSIVASFASGCDHISHIRTQLPYALLAALGATLLYAAAGLIMV